MKKIIILAVLCVMTVSAWGQIEKEYLDNLKKTKYTELLFSRGSKLKIVETKGKVIIGDKLHFGSIIARIKKVIETDNGKYHYFLALDNKKDNENIYISYDDLTRLNMRIEEMKEEFEIDKKQKTNDIYNTYTTDDGFKIGYVCSRISTIYDKWFYKNDISGEIHYISNIDNAYKGFQTWQIAIEEEMQKDKK